MVDQTAQSQARRRQPGVDLGVGESRRLVDEELAVVVEERDQGVTLRGSLGQRRRCHMPSVGSTTASICAVMGGRQIDEADESTAAV